MNPRVQRARRLFAAISAAVFLFLPVLQAAAATIPNDPDFELQWYLSKIQAPVAWDVTRGSRDVIVAILDTGVDYTHPDLAENIWKNPNEVLDGIDNDSNGFPDDLHGWDFVNNVGDPRPHIPASGEDPGGLIHGTLIAGQIGAVGNNGIGVTGIAWKVSLLPLRVLDEQGEGNVDNVVRGIDYAIRAGARVINLSFVGNNPDSELDAAVTRAFEAGVLVVGAGGNDSVQHGLNLDKTPLYPACSNGGSTDRIIGVASTDGRDLRSSFSNFGTRCIDLSAPGEGIYSTSVFDPAFPKFAKPYSGFWNGSSLATPIIAGAAALVLSVKPEFTATQVRDILYAAIDPIDQLNPGYEGKLGRGRINLGKAVSLAQITPILRAASPLPAPPSAPPQIPGGEPLRYVAGTLLRAEGLSAVYYYGRDGKRHPFPDERVYRSWYQNFDAVRLVSPDDLRAVPLGISVRVRPATRLVQFVSLNDGGTAYVVSDPSVYAVDRDREIRHILTEEVARELYGQYELAIVPVLETAFTQYVPGPAIVQTQDFLAKKETLLEAPPSIDDELL